MSNEYNIYTKPDVETIGPVEDIAEDVADEQSDDNEEVIEPTKTIGYVSGCSKLNVRSEPNINASVKCVIKALDEVEIEDMKSTNKFYKVCTESGVCGYCMKKYITVRR